MTLCVTLDKVVALIGMPTLWLSGAIYLRKINYLLVKNNVLGYYLSHPLPFLKFTRKSAMPAGTETEHTQHLRLRETQMSLQDETCRSSVGEDFEGQLREAQQQLEALQQQREQLEQQKCEMDDLNRRKEDFISGQIEITERLSGSVTSIDRELFELRQELEDLEQTRQSFAAHLTRIEKVEPEGWQREAFNAELTRALAMLDQAEEEFDSAVAHFAGGRTRGIFGSLSAGSKARAGEAFGASFRAGLAYNLPILILGAVALIILYYK